MRKSKPPKCKDALWISNKPKDSVNRLLDHFKLAGRWTFLFDRAIRRFGNCNYTKRQISLSAKLTLLNDEPVVRETLLHEIAHARPAKRRARAEMESHRPFDRLQRPTLLWRRSCPADATICGPLPNVCRNDFAQSAEKAFVCAL